MIPNPISISGWATILFLEMIFLGHFISRPLFLKHDNGLRAGGRQREGERVMGKHNGAHGRLAVQAALWDRDCLCCVGVQHRAREVRLWDWGSLVL